ncbi:MAG: acetylglutamate kinase [Thermonemataceae bacterium]
MTENLSIIKIGGDLVNNDTVLASYLEALTRIDTPKILVHGGGKQATALNEQLGIASPMIDGRRVTTKEALAVVTMVYGGLINKNIVAQLQKYGCNAIGLTGADANSVVATKRSPIPIDFGYAGDVKEVNARFIYGLLKENILPVFCAITHDQKGQLLNTNADTMAAEIAMALTTYYKVSLFYCFDKRGVLYDVADESTLIDQLNTGTYTKLKQQGKIHQGMLPKIDNGFHALTNGVDTVRIGNITMLTQSANKCTQLFL